MSLQPRVGVAAGQLGQPEGGRRKSRQNTVLRGSVVMHIVEITTTLVTLKSILPGQEHDHRHQGELVADDSDDRSPDRKRFGNVHPGNFSLSSLLSNVLHAVRIGDEAKFGLRDARLFRRLIGT